MREPFQLDVSSMSDETKSGSEVREGSRIAKVMARAGLCSRRDAEAWIAAGRVSVNGKVLKRPAYNVSDVDDVRVDGQRLGAPERTRLFLFHKPRGLVTTARDPEGRPTIFDALPPDLPRVVAIGRLDINTEGLLLLTNDGGLARVLELPATGWLRRYRVRVHGSVDQARLASLSGGISLDGVDYAAIEAKLDREQGSNAWITMGLREGKNREIKKVLEHLGLAVNRLIRISFGPFELGDLAEGEVAEVRTRVLRDQLGAKLAREAGVDFDAPLIERGAPPAEPPAEAARREGRARQSAPRERAPDGRRGRERERPGRPSGRAEAPRRAPSAPSTPELRRKHVSALRAEIAADGKDGSAPRKRIERSATHDRKGRTVAVERVLPTGEELARRAAAESYGRGRSAERSGAREPGERLRRAGAFDPRNKRDVEARERPPRSESKSGGARPDERPARKASRDEPAPKRRFDRAGGERPPRSDFKPRGERSEGRPPRKAFRDGAPRAGRDALRSASERAPRSDFKPRSKRSEDRPAGAQSRDGAPRERRFDRPEGERPLRRFEGGGRSVAGQGREKPPRSDFKPRSPRAGDRPARTPSRDGEARERRFEGERGPKRFGGGSPRSAGPGRSSGGRPPGKGGSNGPGKGSGGGPRRPPGKP
jgi:23S rRNA pseudouridine2605 synthase